MTLWLSLMLEIDLLLLNYELINNGTHFYDRLILFEIDCYPSILSLQQTHFSLYKPESFVAKSRVEKE